MLQNKHSLTALIALRIFVSISGQKQGYLQFHGGAPAAALPGSGGSQKVRQKGLAPAKPCLPDSYLEHPAAPHHRPAPAQQLRAGALGFSQPLKEQKLQGEGTQLPQVVNSTLTAAFPEIWTHSREFRSSAVPALTSP